MDAREERKEMKRFSLDDLLQMARPHVTVENAHCFALVLARIFDLDEKILLKAIEPPDPQTEEKGTP